LATTPTRQLYRFSALRVEPRGVLNGAKSNSGELCSLLQDPPVGSGF